MRIYPSLKEDFDSPLLPSELLARVQKNTGNRVFEWPVEPFRGEVKATSFAIRRIRWFNNVSNRPNVTGWAEVLPDGKGSRLKLSYYLEPFGFWVGMGIVFLICTLGLFIAADLVFNSAANPLVLLLPPSLFALGLFSIICPFWHEVRSSRRFLIKLLVLNKQVGELEAGQ